MKLTKQRLKEIIKEELSIFNEGDLARHYEEKESGDDDLVEALQTIVAQWEPETPEGLKYEADILEILDRFEELLRLDRPEHDPLDISPAGRRRRAGIKNYPLDR